MKRALVIGSQIEGLRGVHNDTRAMQAMLAARGFEVELRIEAAASRAGILAGYDRLIAASQTDDAAVVYYSGHGCYGTVSTPERRSWQCIVPTDVFAGSATDWRGITAWELSIKQAQLTAKTKNVTVILDACHSAQMSRSAAVREAVPRALSHPVQLGFATHLAQLRAAYQAAFSAVAALGDANAVRLVACGREESAFESPGDDGTFHGAFTRALLDVLAQIGTADISWAAVRDAIRARVVRDFAIQRPDVEGPVRRRLFSLAEDDDRGGVTVTAIGERFRLPVGQLTGVVLGDVYGVMPIGSTSYDARRALGELEVVEVHALTSYARRNAGDTAIPVDAVALPITRNVLRRAVVVVAPDDARPAIEHAIAASPRLRIAQDGEPATVARLRLAGGLLTIEDNRGPMFPAMRFPGELSATVTNVANLGVAQAVRELVGEHGVHERELEIELGTVQRGLPSKLPDHGAMLGLRDRLYVKIANKAHRRLFAHVFNIGVRGKVTLLTRFAPAGVALDRGDPAFVLGESNSGALEGLGLTWPVGLPVSDGPRLDEVVVIVTTAQTSLHGLETQEVLATTRGHGTRLQDTLAQLQDGLTRDVSGGPPPEGFFVKRLSYLLHPRDAAMAGLAFEVDDNPSGHAAAREPEAWLAPGRDAGARSARSADPAVDAPEEIAIRLVDLIVENTRAMFAADIRIDALICTRAPAPAGGLATWTQKYTNIKDGQRLPLDNGLVFLGAVRDFVDITLFVSRDTAGSLELAKLFATRATSPELRDAAGALLVAAGVVAAPWVAAVGASAVLARMAYELVLGVTGTSIGLYRTSFLRRERFGVGRHPAQSVYRAQDFSFSLAIEPVELHPARRAD